jgi:hydrogenase expression/formation protein HypC
MCLGIPGRLVELLDGQQLARADVSGVTRVVNVALLEGEDLAPGDWVLIHVGFALSRIDEREAELALAALQLMGRAYDDEVAALYASRLGEELDTPSSAPAGGSGPGAAPVAGAAPAPVRSEART